MSYVMLCHDLPTCESNITMYPDFTLTNDRRSTLQDRGMGIVKIQHSIKDTIVGAVDLCVFILIFLAYGLCFCLVGVPLLVEVCAP